MQAVLFLVRDEAGEFSPKLIDDIQRNLTGGGFECGDNTLHFLNLRCASLLIIPVSQEPVQYLHFRLAVTIVVPDAARAIRRPFHLRLQIIFDIYQTEDAESLP